uniref:LITAF domain-containing protein n=1 Tax=Gasterosteus aculeatus aculeatus TaxID=481459 RepID=A0AAQ4RPH7_GASAC|nr:lipopolysaccharide-induced tumor necrosis factor-alpha factor homolog isoform X2 [Gasterosteus aculeatus aculeatus]
MAMAQGPFLVGTAPLFAPVPDPGVTQPQQPSVNIAVSSQQTVQQPLQQQVQQPAYIQQQPQFVQPVNQVVVVQPNPTDTSRQKMCPNCRNTGMTQLRYINGMLTWLICGVVGIFGFLPYMCIPSCVNSCKDVEHSCPSCGHVLYVHRRT